MNMTDFLLSMFQWPIWLWLLFMFSAALACGFLIRRDLLRFLALVLVPIFLCSLVLSFWGTYLVLHFYVSSVIAFAPGMIVGLYLQFLSDKRKGDDSEEDRKE